MRRSLYEKYASEDSVVENLRDAGCSRKQIECFLDWQEEERTEDQLSMPLDYDLDRNRSGKRTGGAP